MLTLRPLGARVPVSRRTLVVARVLIEVGMRLVAPTLPGSGVVPVNNGAVRGEWVRGGRVSGQQVGQHDGALLYVHGAGFVAGSARAFRGVASRLSDATAKPVLSVDYRLAPEHGLPAAQEDVVAAYDWLRAQGFAPHQVDIAGDSAGGFLAADMVVRNARAGGSPPGALLLFAPMVDLALDLAADFPGAAGDGLLSAELARRAVARSTGAPYDLRPEPGLRLPPALVQTSDVDLFGGDAVALAERWRATGARCEAQVWRDQMHVFQALPRLVPEAGRAYRAVADFASRSRMPRR